MKTIDAKVVKHVAHLGRLELDDKELELYSGQLASILTYISKLNEIDTKDVVPTSHALATLKNVFRKDVLRQSLTPDEALANAPSRDDDFFKVPQIIEGK
ncbi:MAG: Asp-tRNA(Asn)/Glu-tRNA(Gln) amidotransferase subunit GatC [Candidatus Omnitrophica bacterium]|nr:Asp-tRNA(Asn)/Glu-tRNA(Gln) amidotransferase subunit GatC [Candidatus Omnitrophota bacterium]